MAAKLGFMKGINKMSASNESALATTVPVSKIPVPSPISSPLYNSVVTRDRKKLKGACSKCKGEFRLQSDGMLYKHGHRGNPCNGSYTAPSIGSIIQSQSASTSNTNDGTSSSQSYSTLNGNSQNSVMEKVVVMDDDDDLLKHPIQTCAVIKYIPKSARRACSTLTCQTVTRSDEQHRFCEKMENALVIRCNYSEKA